MKNKVGNLVGFNIDNPLRFFEDEVTLFTILGEIDRLKPMYKEKTIIHYLDGSIEATFKNGFLRNNIKLIFKPIKNGKESN